MDKNIAQKIAQLLSELIYIVRLMEDGPLTQIEYDDLGDLAVQARQLAKPK